MNTYRVCWTIDLEADSPQAAAEKALAIQRNNLSAATIFEIFGPDCPVEGFEVDLSSAAPTAMNFVRNASTWCSANFRPI